MKTKIEVGQKYNRLTVLEKLGYDKHNNAFKSNGPTMGRNM